MKPQFCLLPLATTALLVAMPCYGEDWTQWRGPRFDGVSNETGLATHWGPETNILWRVPLPGPAGATPIVAGGRLFVSTVDGDRLLLLCFSTDGNELWRREIGSGNQPARRDEGNSASPSPTTDGKSVVVLMGSGDLASFDFDGELQWKFNVQDRYGKLQISFGLSSTPILYDGRVYFQLIHGDGDPDTHEARVVAVDAATGKQVWAHQRVTGASKECEQAYTSPMIYGLSGQGAKPMLLTHGADFIIAHALQDGCELWRCGGMNPPGNYHRTLRFVSSPGVGEGLIVAPTAKKGPVFGLLPGGSGDIQATQFVAWKRDRNTPDVPTPLIHDGLVYLCAENGVLRCADAATGETVYTERLISDRYRASPVFADGKVFCISRKGVVSVVQPGREFKLLAENDMQEPTSSSLAFCDGVIYQRTFKALYAIKP